MSPLTQPSTSTQRELPTLVASDFHRIAKALSDPQRLEFLERLAASPELCCSDLVSCCSVSQATVSHHLKELVNAGLVEKRKEGQFAYLRFRAEVMTAYLDELRRRLGL